MTTHLQTQIDKALQRLELQQRSLQHLTSALDDAFIEAVSCLSSADKIITSGLGKSGFIAQKMAATITSLAIPAYYIHPVDALHGDCGIVTPNDCLVAFSKSGETPELLRFANHVMQMGVNLVAITSRDDSNLARLANAPLTIHASKEFDDDDIVPTTSTTSSLVIADLLALAIADVKGTTLNNLRQTHPNGGIGSTLLRTVDEVMHTGEMLPTVRNDSSLTAALVELTLKGLGAVCVVSPEGYLQGILTDGDVRRLVQAGKDAQKLLVTDVMTVQPVTVEPGTTLHEVLVVMERGKRQISVVPVVSNGLCVGLVRVHDIVRVNL